MQDSINQAKQTFEQELALIKEQRKLVRKTLAQIRSRKNRLEPFTKTAKPSKLSLVAFKRWNKLQKLYQSLLSEEKELVTALDNLDSREKMSRNGLKKLKKAFNA